LVAGCVGGGEVWVGSGTGVIVRVGWLKAVELGTVVAAGGAVGVTEAGTVGVGDDVSVALSVGDPCDTGVADGWATAPGGRVAEGVAIAADAAVGESPG
jgi:hypothetical protein